MQCKEPILQFSSSRPFKPSSHGPIRRKNQVLRGVNNAQLTRSYNRRTDTTAIRMVGQRYLWQRSLCLSIATLVILCPYISLSLTCTFQSWSACLRPGASNSSGSPRKQLPLSLREEEVNYYIMCNLTINPHVRWLFGRSVGKLHPHAPIGALTYLFVHSSDNPVSWRLHLTQVKVS